MRLKKIFLSVLLIIISFTVIGCSKTTSPKDSFEKFASSWEGSDFSSMYKLLSADIKENVDEKYFVDRYNKVYGDAKVSKVTVNPQYPDKFKADKNNEVTFPVSVTLDTPIGPKQFTYNAKLVEEKRDKKKSWYISWEEAMVLPELSKGYGVKFEKMLGKRGEIKDRKGNGLAVNKQAVAISIVPEQIASDRANIVSKLSEILGITVEQIESKLNEGWVKANPKLLVPIINIPRDEMPKILKALELPGVKGPSASSLVRSYPAKDAAAHLIGYIGSITDEELKKYKSQGYDANEVIGKTGLESIFEMRLRGEIGGTLYILDEKGNKKESILQKMPKDGEDITLTIDINLQRDIFAQYGGEAGASVAVHPKTGEVLAMVSSPSYDPNIFIAGISGKQYDALLNNPRKPLISRFDKAVVPGSTFKPVTAAIGLRSGKLNPDNEMKIDGTRWKKASFGDYSITRKHADDSSVNLLDAFVYSDNIYFARAALDIGKEEFLKGAKDFGIGEKINFQYPMNPSQIGSLDSEIEIADSGYGQGKVLMNPLHLALIYSSFVNEGNVLNPILELKDKAEKPSIWKEKVTSKEVSDTILRDLVEVVENLHGTAHSVKVQGITFAGKTGTAEFGKVQQDTVGKENGWFAALNTDNPKLMLIMMIEDVPTTEGSGHVLPKAFNIMKNINKY